MEGFLVLKVDGEGRREICEEAESLPRASKLANGLRGAAALLTKPRISYEVVPREMLADLQAR